MDIKIQVFFSKMYNKNWPKENAIEFLAWFKEKINAIPEEFRSKAIVEIDSITDYGGNSSASVEIYYYRPETEKEIKEREAKELTKNELLM